MPDPATAGRTIHTLSGCGVALAFVFDPYAAIERSKAEKASQLSHHRSNSGRSENSAERVERNDHNTLKKRGVSTGDTHTAGASTHVSQVSRGPSALSEIERDDFEERAAIMEFCGGQSRDQAEQCALDDILAKRRFQDGRHTET